MRKEISIIVIMIILCGSLFSNSIFSFKGFPEQYYGNDVYATGMGGAGFGDLFRINTSFSNPALAATCNEVTFSSAASMNKYYYSDNKGDSFVDDGFDIPYFVISIPFKNHRFGFNYNSITSGILEREVRADNLDSDGNSNSLTPSFSVYG